MADFASAKGGRVSKERKIIVRASSALHLKFRLKCVKASISMNSVLLAAIKEFVAGDWEPKETDKD